MDPMELPKPRVGYIASFHNGVSHYGICFKVYIILEHYFLVRFILSSGKLIIYPRVFNEIMSI
jgi:hypothetical protein